MLAFSRSPEQVLESLIAHLPSDLRNTLTAVNTPGSVIRGILYACASAISDVYEELDRAYQPLWLSRASGPLLDAHGEALQVPRLPGEDDETYRARIIRSFPHRGVSDEAAIREAALSTPGVREVRIVPYTHGTGSFTLQVLADNLTPDGIASTLESVRQTITPLLPAGIYANVVHAKLLPVQVTLLPVDEQGRPVSSSVAEQVRQAVIDYVQNLRMGEELIALRLAAAALVSGVSDVSVTRLAVDDAVSLADNYRPFADEKLYIRARSDVVVLLAPEA